MNMKGWKLFLVWSAALCLPASLRAEATVYHTDTIPVSVIQLPDTAHAQPPHEHSVNFGVKGGFTASLFLVSDFSINGQEITEVQNNYKIGYFASVFMRINFDRHFIQPEISYNVSMGSVSVSNSLANSALLPENALVKTKVTSIDLPILYGYKFIDVHPYGMAFFVGPKVAWSWKQQTENEYSGFYQQAIRETGYPFNYSAVAGLGVNVSNVFFDFRYEIGLHNLTRSIDFDRQATEAPYNESMIIVRKRRNVMSFSVGVIF